MEQIKIGNWLITDDTIWWNGKNEEYYYIPKEGIVEGGPGNRENMYDWLVHLPEKTWLTENDIYALNTAFIYALELWGFDFNTRSFIETLDEQQKEINKK